MVFNKPKYIFAVCIVIALLSIPACKNPVSPKPSVISVTVEASDTIVVRGGQLEFTADVQVSRGAAATVEWTVEGKNSSGGEVLLHNSTSFTEPEGNTIKLNVATGETAATLTITATSTVDENLSDSVEVTVTSGIGNITVTPATIQVYRGAQQPFQATVQVTGTPTPPNTVTWSIVSGGSGGTAFGTGANAHILSVAENQTVPATITIRATSTFDTTRYGQATVTVPAVNQLPPPVSPALSESGVATWNAASPETNVARYSVQLYRGTDTVGAAVLIEKGPAYSHNFLSAMRDAAGSYTFRVKAIPSDPINYAESNDVPSPTARVVVQRPVPTGLNWNGDLAQWTAGTGDTNTTLGYEVRLFRNSGTDPVRTETVTTASVNFSTSFATTGNNIYTFTVTALGNTALVLPAAVTAPSAGKEIWNQIWLIGDMSSTQFNPPGIQLTKETDGTFTWKNGDNVPANTYFRLSLTATGGDFFAPAANNTVVTLGVTGNAMTRFASTTNAWRLSDAGYYEFTVHPIERSLRAERPITVDTITITTTTDDYPFLLWGHVPYAFSALPTGRNADLAVITWTVSGNTNAGTTFNGNMLTVSASETATELIVTASYGSVTSAPVTFNVKDPNAVGDVGISFAIVDEGDGLDIEEDVAVRTIYKTGGVVGTDDRVIFTVANQEPSWTYSWIVSGRTLSGTTITLNAADYGVGYHSVRLIVTNNNGTWSLPTELGFIVAAVKP